MPDLPNDPTRPDLRMLHARLLSILHSSPVECAAEEGRLVDAGVADYDDLQSFARAVRESLDDRAGLDPLLAETVATLRRVLPILEPTREPVGTLADLRALARSTRSVIERLTGRLVARNQRPAPEPARPPRSICSTCIGRGSILTGYASPATRPCPTCSTGEAVAEEITALDSALAERAESESTARPASAEQHVALMEIAMRSATDRGATATAQFYAGCIQGIRLGVLLAAEVSDG